MGFLRTREERGERVLTPSVDPSQLQIICQHLERIILPRKEATAAPAAIAEISEADLGGDDGLNEILGDFYRREIEEFSPEDRNLVRSLCENGLISKSNRRLSLEEGEIQSNFGVSSQLLDELVSRRLVRAEPRVGSVYYELAHDTLVAPILAYRNERVTAEETAAEDSARASLLTKWAFRFGLANIVLFGLIGGIATAMSLLAIRTPPLPRKGLWKPRLALLISYLWLALYSAALFDGAYDSEGRFFKAGWYVAVVLQTSLGAMIGIAWPVQRAPTRRSVWVVTSGILALAFAVVGLIGVLKSNEAPIGTLGVGTTASIFDVSIGQCFDDPGAGEIVDVELLACSTPHDVEVYAFATLTGLSGTFPGRDALFEELADVCVQSFQPYVGRDYRSSIYDYLMIIPTEGSWDMGDRVGTCLIALEEDGIRVKVTGSARDSGQ